LRQSDIIITTTAHEKPGAHFAGSELHTPDEDAIRQSNRIKSIPFAPPPMSQSRWRREAGLSGQNESRGKP
jgi:hypothetical protein